MQNNNNTIAELNNQLFAALRSLNTEIKGEELKEEIDKAKAIADIGKVIVANNRTALDAIQMVQNGEIYKEKVAGLIGC